MSDPELWCGYTRRQSVPRRGIGGRRMYQRTTELGAGFTHAVRAGDSETLCDKPVKAFGGAWPPRSMEVPCPECLAKLS